MLAEPKLNLRVLPGYQSYGTTILLHDDPIAQRSYEATLIWHNDKHQALYFCTSRPIR